MPSFILKFIYLNESHFYNDFTVEEGGLPRPECYHVGADLKSSPPKFIILQENALIGALGNDGKSIQYTRTKGCDNKEHLTMVMNGLAKFHASFWAMKYSPSGPIGWAKHPSKSYCGLLRNAIPLMTSGSFSNLPKLLTDEFHPDGTPVAKLGGEFQEVLTWRPEVLGNLRRITKQLLQDPLTLCHCDTHLDNVFFHDRYTGGCGFIDFGNMRFQNALSDVSFFMATCVEPDVRAKLEKDLVRNYHNQLVANGVDYKKYSWDRCWHDYRMQMWLAFIQLAAGAGEWAKHRKARTGMFAHPDKIKVGDQQLLEMYATINRRCASALKELDWLKLATEFRPKYPSIMAYSCCSFACID